VKKFNFLRESLSGVATEMFERVRKEGGDMDQGDKSVIGLLSMSIFVVYKFALLSTFFILIFCGWMEMTNDNFILQYSQILGRRLNHEAHDR
jgi:hypothetical protein